MRSGPVMPDIRRIPGDLRVGRRGTPGPAGIANGVRRVRHQLESRVVALPCIAKPVTAEGDLGA